MFEPVRDQPILFEQPSLAATCCDPTQWTHQFFELDPIGFQFLVSQEGGENLIQNPNYSDGDSSTQADWETSGSVVYLGSMFSRKAHLVNDGSAILQDDISGLNTGGWFQLEIDVNVSSLDATSTTFEVFGFQQPFERVNSSGGSTYTAIVQAGPTGSISVTFNNPSMVTCTFLIEEIRVIAIEMPTVTTEDVDGNTLSALTGSTYNAPFFSTIFVADEAERDAGCFRIKVESGTDDTEYLSELIKLIPANNCDMLIGGCSQNTLYDPNTPIYFRAKGKVLADQSPVYDRFTTRQNSGRNRLNYARKSKAFTLTVFRVPEHVRDFIFSLPLFNVIGIRVGSGVQTNYFVHEVPEAPEFTVGDDDLATVKMTLIFKEELSESIFENECTFILPPKALGSRGANKAYQVDTDTAIRVP